MVQVDGSKVGMEHILSQGILKITPFWLIQSSP